KKKRITCKNQTKHERKKSSCRSRGSIIANKRKVNRSGERCSNARRRGVRCNMREQGGTRRSETQEVQLQHEVRSGGVRLNTTGRQSDAKRSQARQ
ncbi:hypothetical protein PIB30_081942, partial [Stylosanthes scabra]|nr:hypothetical protein [Stylosanthes scabra]